METMEWISVSITMVSIIYMLTQKIELKFSDYPFLIKILLSLISLCLLAIMIIRLTPLYETLCHSFMLSLVFPLCAVMFSTLAIIHIVTKHKKRQEETNDQ